MSWTCSVCGERHEEELRDIRAGLPDVVYALRELEREERAEVSDDWCRYVDEAGVQHAYVRGVVHLPIIDSDDDFRFGVWIEVTARDFHRLGDLWDDGDDGGASRPFFGTLAYDLNLYPGTLGLRVALQLRDVRRLPGVILLGGDHELVRDQRRGITPARAEQLAESVLH